MVQGAEGGQVSGVEGSVGQVGAFRLCSVRTCLLEYLDSRPGIAARTGPAPSTAKDRECLRLRAAPPGLRAGQCDPFLEVVALPTGTALS